ncbi:hypothetical protein I4U23_018544 [Adineta vaga]|nr:hypothetical protein I4U23_018544 [Adineta vaga]
MNYFHRIIFLIIYFGTLILCQSQRTNIANHGLYSSINISCTNGNCRQRTAIIAGSILGSVVGIILCLVIIVVCWNHWKGRPLKTNLKFIHSTDRKHSQDDSYDNKNLFQSGIWSSRHIQYGIWHGFYRLTLTFDPQLLKVTGAGSDSSGVFTVDGIYSVKTKRISLIKTYHLEANKRSENFKYQMIIQLRWNCKTSQFEGKWYVRTKTYRGENKFELKFSNQQTRILPCKTV